MHPARPQARVNAQRSQRVCTLMRVGDFFLLPNLDEGQLKHIMVVEFLAQPPSNRYRRSVIIQQAGNQLLRVLLRSSRTDG
jgi:hypothetical protein